jgi:hypothetical protein
MIQKQQLITRQAERLNWFLNTLEIKEGIIAGGCLRRLFSGEPLGADVDVFCTSAPQRQRILSSLPGGDPKSTKRQLLWHNNRKYDIVAPLFKDVKDVLEHFDMTVAQIGLDLKTKDLYLADTFWQDLAGRRIIFTPPLIRPMGTVMRVQKYIKQGYRMCVGQARVLVDELREVDEDLLWDPLYLD